MNEFKTRLEINRWYSQKTISNYMRTLKKFDNYLIWIWKRVEQCEAIDPVDLENFILENKNNWIATRTLNNYLSWIKTYINYCAMHWYKVFDTRQIIFAKEVKRKIEALSEEEAEQLYNYFKNIVVYSKRWELIKIRNLLMVSLFLYCWLRISELSWIKIKDIQEYMQIVWKWWERRTIVIMEEEMKLINYYLFIRKDKSEYLFVNHCNNYKTSRLSNTAIQTIIRDWWKRAWIKHWIFPHMLRHTFATLLLRKHANIYHIQQLLWHKNLNTTQIYLSVVNTELKETQEKLPRF